MTAPTPPVLKFEDSPESQQYVKQLEKGEIELPAAASAVEKIALKKLKETVQHMRNLAQQRAQIAQQIERLKQDHFQLGVEEDKTSGTLSGYATLLASAEGARREAKAAEPAVKTAPKKPTPKGKPALKVAEKPKVS